MSCTADFSGSPYADEVRGQVEAALEGYTELGDGCPDDLRAAMRYSLLAPGKRLRPMLAILAAEACGGSRVEAMPAACAVEMVHAYSLIHDDLPAMDDDDLRRGLPTCHRKFGEALAILAGDALLALAMEVLADGVWPAEAAAACCRVLARAAGPCELVGGQADDVRNGGGAAGVEMLESIHRRKTGAMIGASLRLGAITARAGAAELDALDGYGRSLGLLFQITDDLLDVCGRQEQTGKRVGKDGDLKKLTYPGLLGTEESLRRAEQLCAEACRKLAPLGSRAHGLEAVALSVLRRNR
jgi:geranylgeranyl diphosphate synthase type II